jgi:NAD(P)H-nitrite reductase large subunit
MKTMVTPRIKFMVSACPNSAAEARPVKIVATAEEYFFKIVSVEGSSKGVL